MVKELKVTEKYTTSLYDSKAGKMCVIEKIVDVTDDCHGLCEGGRCLFFYTRTWRGRIVEIAYPYNNGGSANGNSHFFLKELAGSNPHKASFMGYAEKLGLSGAELASLIETCAPLA